MITQPLNDVHGAQDLSFTGATAADKLFSMEPSMHVFRCAIASVVALVFAFQGRSAPPGQAELGRRSQLAPNVYFEKEGERRRVIVAASICLREGQLEGLLCRSKTKEHEYILAADVDGRAVHAALIVAGARPGAPVQFAPKYVPVSGSTIKVMLRFEKDGKPMTVPAGEWIQDAKSKKPLTHNWVFGGSRFVPDPDDKTKPPYYLANHGDLICTCNMESAMLDLTVRSPKKFDDRLFTARTAQIPPLGTKVEVILEPVPDKKAP